MKIQSKKNLMFASALIGVVSFASSMAFANEAHKGEHKPFGHKKEEMNKEYYEEIKASPEQRTKLDALHTQLESQVKPLYQSISDKKHALMVYVISPNSTETEALKKEQEIEQLKSKVDRLYIDHGFQKKAILNPEQQQKSVDFLQKKSDEWKQKEDKESTEKDS